MSEPGEQSPGPSPAPPPGHGPDRRQPSGCLTAFLIIAGALLFLPGLCVSVFDVGYGQLAVGLADAMIVIGLLRITWGALTRDADDANGRTAKIVVLVVVWGALIYLIALSLQWVSDMNHFGQIRWH